MRKGSVLDYLHQHKFLLGIQFYVTIASLNNTSANHTWCLPSLLGQTSFTQETTKI